MVGRDRRRLHLLTEFAARIGLVIIFCVLEGCSPFKRMIQPEEVWLYRNPMTESYVPGFWLWRMVILLPLLVILTTYAVTRDAVDLVTAIMVFTLASPLNGVLTNVIKLCVGRPRPDFIARCWPDGEIPDGAFDTSDLPCKGNLATIDEGRKSFPSGHSSFSFVTWGFIFFYLAGKLGTFRCRSPAPSLHLLLLFSCLLAPTCIAISRTADYHHHWQDVLVGSLIGLVTVWVVYRQHYPPLSSPQSSKPLTSISRDPSSTSSEV